MTGNDDGSGAQVVRALHEAYNDRDRDRFLGCLAEDVIWHVEGDHPMAGPFHGRARVWEGHFEPLWPSPARFEDREVVAHGEHVVALAEVIHDFGDGQTAYDTVEILRVDAGKVSERWAFTSGQRELDRFFTRGCAADPEAEGLPR